MSWLFKRLESKYQQGLKDLAASDLVEGLLNMLIGLPGSRWVRQELVAGEARALQRVDECAGLALWSPTRVGWNVLFAENHAA